MKLDGFMLVELLPAPRPQLCLSVSANAGAGSSEFKRSRWRFDFIGTSVLFTDRLMVWNPVRAGSASSGGVFHCRLSDMTQTDPHRC